MKLTQLQFRKDTGWSILTEQQELPTAQLVLVFGLKDLLVSTTWFDDLKNKFPQATIISASTSGEIGKNDVYDNTIIATAIEFKDTKIEAVIESIETVEQSEQIGRTLAEKIGTESLVHAMVFSDGIRVNGTALVTGITQVLPRTMGVTGGLAGDQANFKETVVGLNGPPKPGAIVLLGFYGEHLQVGFGSLGGWDPFGPDRKITKSSGNKLFEIDNKPALALYKEYLGEKAKELPGSGLLFPLSLTIAGKESEGEVVRTLLSIDENEQSMTFAGDIPEGASAKLMKANFDRLIDGAEGAAKVSHDRLGQTNSELAILISCVGRKLVLGDRVADEVEAVQSTLGPTTLLCGFYSYGEICPGAATGNQCQLHNQTMTITTFREQ